MIEENKHSNFQDTMPLDYESYLLSASPPGFEVQYKNYMMLQDGLDLSGLSKARRNGCYYNPFSRQVEDEEEDPTASCVESECISTQELNSVYNRDSSSCLKTYESRTSDSSTDGSQRTKKVSFADEIGLQLSQIRIFTESPHSPPRLRRSLLSSLANGATASVTACPPLTLKFVQPAANYISFREKLDRENVCLENVILRDYTVVGTVKVKNMAFEKSVKIRYTYDSWESFHDQPANFVQNTQGCATPYDTFSFEVNIPPAFDPRKNIQFVICFSCNNTEYWDNNGGDNYSIASADVSSPTPKEETNQHPVFSLDSDSTDWTNFSSWSSNDNTIPYY